MLSYLGVLVYCGMFLYGLGRGLDGRRDRRSFRGQAPSSAAMEIVGGLLGIVGGVAVVATVVASWCYGTAPPGQLAMRGPAAGVFRIGMVMLVVGLCSRRAPLRWPDFLFALGALVSLIGILLNDSFT